LSLLAATVPLRQSHLTTAVSLNTFSRVCAHLIIPSSLCGFVVDKVALGRVSLHVLQFYPVNIIRPWLPILISCGE
jgi:hypothetical protein